MDSLLFEFKNTWCPSCPLHLTCGVYVHIEISAVCSTVASNTFIVMHFLLLSLELRSMRYFHGHIAHSFFICVTLAPTTGARLTPGGVPCSAASCVKYITKTIKLILAFHITDIKLLNGTQIGRAHV